MKTLVPVYPFPVHPVVAAALPQDGYLYVEALPGGPNPVLAIRKAPPWVCDAIVVEKPEHLLEALAVVSGNGIKLVTVRDTISAVFGKGEQLVEAVGFNETPAQARVRFA